MPGPARALRTDKERPGAYGEFSDPAWRRRLERQKEALAAERIGEALAAIGEALPARRSDR